MGTKIEWTDETWNPVTGCTKISAGCANCYAERIAHRFPGTFPRGFEVTLWHTRLLEPLRWRRPRRIFICSMGDLFHAKVPDHFVEAVFGTVRACPQHQFMVLTKRPRQMRYFALANWPANLWAGVTVEDRKSLWRLRKLVDTPYPHRFVSFEPLLEALPDMRVELCSLDWVVVGCESGTGRRPMDPEWVRDIMKQCLGVGVPMMLKQMEVGGKVVKLPGLDGKEWAEGPGLELGGR